MKITNAIFPVSDDTKSSKNKNRTYRTPILRERWYEIGVISVRVVSISSAISGQLSRIPPGDTIEFQNVPIVEEVIKGSSQNSCRELNKVQSILDSGTTNIRLPEGVFGKVSTSRHFPRLSTWLTNCGMVAHNLILVFSFFSGRT